MIQVITVKMYTVNQVKAARACQIVVDDDMDGRGYVPVSQSWSPGERSGINFLIALLLRFVLIGFLAFLYIIIASRDGDANYIV
jgi:hypothetical protein